MLLGELVRIDKDVIRLHDDKFGNNKQRYNPSFTGRQHSEEYTSMYPLTENTTLICLFVNTYRRLGIYYIPYKEPLLRKYPKRVLRNSFVNIGETCTMSVVDRVTNINRLVIDIKLAYLYLNFVHFSGSGVMSRLGIHTKVLTLISSLSGDTKVKDLIGNADDIVPGLISGQNIFRSSILASGAIKARGKVATIFRLGLGNALEDLFKYEEPTPSFGTDAPSLPDIRNAPPPEYTIGGSGTPSARMGRVYLQTANSNPSVQAVEEINEERPTHNAERLRLPPESFIIPIIDSHPGTEGVGRRLEEVPPEEDDMDEREVQDDE